MLKPQPEINMKQIQNYMQDSFGIPKLELHAHIGGCMRGSTFMELALARNVDLDKVNFYKLDM